MAVKRTRQPIDAQFRAEALRLVSDHPERQKSSIARELGIDPQTLYAWIQADKKHKASQPDALEARFKAFHQAVSARRLKHRTLKVPIIFHSDQGGQYNSNDFKDELKKYGLVSSMGSSGDYYHNAPLPIS